MTFAKFASFSLAGHQGYGLVTGQGIVDLSRRYGSKWPTLREVVANDAVARLSDAASALAPDLSLADIRFEIPIPRRKRSSASASISLIATRSTGMGRQRLPTRRCSSVFRALSPGMGNR